MTGGVDSKVISDIAKVIASGEAIKANGPIEHWLTTLATGFWGFDDSKESMWANLKKGDVLVFQSGSPNWDFVEKIKPLPNVSGFIGAGIVDRTSKKTEPRWLSEVIECQVHGSISPKLWPNLVHFSDVVWFGNVDDIPASAVQELIEECKSTSLDIRAHIECLAENKLTLNAMKDAGFTYAPMGTGNRLGKNAHILAELLMARASETTWRSYSDGATAHVLAEMVSALDASHYECAGVLAPAERSTQPPVKSGLPKSAVIAKDYVQEATDNLALGRIGEDIVFARERQRVLDELGELHVSKVVHVSVMEGDGAGYDIRTVRRCSQGISEHYLEVKTTTGGRNTPFFISENERRFASTELDRYEVVRLHSLDQKKGRYLEYRLTARELLDTSMTPVNYRVNVGCKPQQQLEACVAAEE